VKVKTGKYRTGIYLRVLILEVFTLSVMKRLRTDQGCCCCYFRERLRGVGRSLLSSTALLLWSPYV